MSTELHFLVLSSTNTFDFFFSTIQMEIHWFMNVFGPNETHHSDSYPTAVQKFMVESVEGMNTGNGGD